MKSLKLVVNLIAIACVVLMQCERNFDSLLEANNPGKGSCYVQVTGYINKCFQGEAVYQNVPTGRGYTLFILLLRDITEPGVDYRFVEFQGGEKPGVGTHDVISNNSSYSAEDVVMGLYSDSDIRDYFHSTGGKIIIDNADGPVLKGSTEFNGKAHISANGEVTVAEIHVMAYFYAEEGNTEIIIN